MQAKVPERRHLMLLMTTFPLKLYFFFPIKRAMMGISKLNTEKEILTQRSLLSTIIQMIFINISSFISPQFKFTQPIFAFAYA